MSGLDHIKMLASAYGRRLGIENHTLSWKVFGDSKKLDALFDGADLQVTRYERALQWFSDHWPANEPWPAGAPRPARTAHGVEEQGPAFEDEARYQARSRNVNPVIFLPAARSEEERQAAIHALLHHSGWASDGTKMTRDEMHER